MRLSLVQWASFGAAIVSLAGASEASLMAAGHMGATLGSGPIGDSYPGDGIDNIHRTQSFEAVLTGPLEKIRLSIVRSNSPVNPLQIELYSAAADLPDALLGAVEVAAADVPNSGGGLLSVDFSALGINIITGTRYVIVAGTASGVEESEQYGWLTTSAPYALGRPGLSLDSGASFANQNTYDFIFDVWVPAPGTMILAGAAVVGSLRRRRNH